MKTKERNLKLIDGRWFFDFSLDGKRYIRIGGKTKEEARAAMARLRVELSAGPKESPAEVEDPLFKDFAAEYLELYAKPNKRSWERDERSIKHLDRCFGDLPLSQISLLRVERYRVERRALVALGTVNRELSCLKGILSKALDWDKLESFPLRKIKINLRDEPRRERVLTREEEARLLAEAAPYLKPMITLALHTGMRQGEILKLRAEHVNLAYSSIVIPAENSKSKRARRIPLNSAVLELLRPLLKDQGFIFHKSRGEGFHRIGCGFKAACERAKIEDLRFHDLRHTFETRSLEGGANPVNIVKIMGHHSMSFSLDHYHHPSQEMLLADVETLVNTKEYTKESITH
ncbi:MAG: site-specific integrase [Acidobacteria bacterium]|nr:site-specific integrase [Acidobacteriota bacterium]